MKHEKCQNEAMQNEEWEKANDHQPTHFLAKWMLMDLALMVRMELMCPMLMQLQKWLAFGHLLCQLYHLYVLKRNLFQIQKKKKNEKNNAVEVENETMRK